jgi:hypothetical protein
VFEDESQIDNKDYEPRETSGMVPKRIPRKAREWKGVLALCDSPWIASDLQCSPANIIVETEENKDKVVDSPRKGSIGFKQG